MLTIGVMVTVTVAVTVTGAVMVTVTGKVMAPVRVTVTVVITVTVSITVMVMVTGTVTVILSVVVMVLIGGVLNSKVDKNMIEEKIRPTYECMKCGWSWVPRKFSPKSCPKCKQYDWDKVSEDKHVDGD